MLPQLSVGREVLLRVDGMDLRGRVKRVDRYPNTVKTARVIILHFNHEINIDGGSGFEDWKGYLIEEPANKYRFNLLQSDGQRIRTTNYNSVGEAAVVEVQVTLSDF